MKALSCPKCGAPVEVDESSRAATVRCPFCGSTLAPTRTLSAAGAPVVIDLRRVTRAGATAARWVALGFVLVLLATGGILWVALGSARQGLARVPASLVRPAPSRPPARPAARRLAELADLTRADAWQRLDLAAPAGGFAAFDPVAELSWATTIGQAWRRDALLERIDVVRLRPDGTLNLADDEEASAMFRFVSPQAVADFERQARLSTRVEAETGLFVKLAGGVVTALVVEARGDDLPPDFPADALALRELLPRLRRDPRFAELPFLSGYLIRLDAEGWVWYLSPLGGVSLPRARARDGRIWPYRAAR